MIKYSNFCLVWTCHIMSKLIQRIQRKPGTNNVKSQTILSNQKLPGMQRNKNKNKKICVSNQEKVNY